MKNAPDTKKILDFFLDTKWDTEQYQILSQIPKSFADTKSSISDTKMATLKKSKSLKYIFKVANRSAPFEDLNEKSKIRLSNRDWLMPAGAIQKWDETDQKF